MTLKDILENPHTMNNLHPGMSGIYFHIVGREVVYVGQAVRCVWKRMCSHYFTAEPFDSFNFVRCDEWAVNWWEDRYIKALWPARNTNNKPKAHPKWRWNRLTCPNCQAVFVAEPDKPVLCHAGCGCLVDSPPRDDWPAPPHVKLLPLDPHDKRYLPRKEPKAPKPKKLREPHPNARQKTAFELMCVRAYGSLSIAQVALGAKSADFKLWCSHKEIIAPPSVTSALRNVCAARMAKVGEIDPLSVYSVVSPDGFFLTLKLAAKAAGVSLEKATNRARQGTNGWYLVPYGFQPGGSP